MPDTVIRFDSVSKLFRLTTGRPRTLQEAFLRLVGKRAPERRESFWAVRDVDLSINRGETVALVGANGAGKSTLLKLTSRILVPTSGKVSVQGRVASLLELGTGFHPDLTGRENIHLNGSLLGLTQGTMRGKEETIIAFSGLGDFIDTPVRHYSSGMYMRLGFAIAVHVEPDILLVDEVLAVGDAAFQSKCLDKINQLRQDQVTILFVSHDLDAVRRICQRAVWMEEGRLEADGSTESVVQRYLWQVYQEGTLDAVEDAGRRWGTHRIEIKEVQLLDGEGQQKQTFASGEPLVVEIHYAAPRPVERPIFGLAIHGGDGTHISGPNTRFADLEIPRVMGDGTLRYTIPEIPLLEGLYYISVASHNWDDTEMFDYHDRLYPFQVIPSGGEQFGLFTLKGEWSWRTPVQID